MLKTSQKSTPVKNVKKKPQKSIKIIRRDKTDKSQDAKLTIIFD